MGLNGREVYNILGLSDTLKPMSLLNVVAEDDQGKQIKFSVTVRLNTDVEVKYYKNGGILHTVLRNLL